LKALIRFCVGLSTDLISVSSNGRIVYGLEIYPEKLQFIISIVKLYMNSPLSTRMYSPSLK
jgi:hypothetical protein